MGKIVQSATELIGNTPILQVNNFQEKIGAKNARILAKLEYLNPAGSVKDRIALKMIQDAEEKAKQEASKYLEENRNKIEALEIVCTRPADLTLADLRKLSMTLDANGYNTIQLNTAVQKVTNEECAADIITLIRRYAIGSPLISHEERIHNAIKKLNKAHNFTAGEKKWIDRIEKYLINESVLNVHTFDEYMAWRNQGGFAKVNKIFNNQLSSIIKELNTYLYAG